MSGEYRRTAGGADAVGRPRAACDASNAVGNMMRGHAEFGLIEAKGPDELASFLAADPPGSSSS